MVGRYPGTYENLTYTYLPTQILIYVPYEPISVRYIGTSSYSNMPIDF